MDVNSITASIEKNGASAILPADRPPGRTWGKLFAGLFSLLMIGATFSPIVQNWRKKPKDELAEGPQPASASPIVQYWREDPKDDFPLSYYPMFSQKRSEDYQVHYIVGIDSQGQRHLLSHKLAGSGGFNQTRRQINKVVREKKADDGERPVDELCRSIAAKVARKKEPPYTEIVTVRIVTGTYRFDDYFHGNKTPLKERVRASAPVERGTP